MAASKTTIKSTTKSGTATEGYVFQPFGAKAVALIYKYNLQGEDNYKKLITSFERITSLPDTDPRKENLIDLWETEFNRIFKDFWETFSGKMKSSKKSGVEGWKDRLDVKEASNAPDQKRKDLLNRLTPGFNTTGRKTKEEILQRAGYKENIQTGSFNFSAEGKTGQNLRQLESLLDVAEERGLAEPESFLANEQPTATTPSVPFTSSNGLTYDEDGYLVGDDREHAKPDPNLETFVKGGAAAKNLAAAPVVETPTPVTPTPVTQNTPVVEPAPVPEERNFVADESMSREQFNIMNNINASPEAEGTVGVANPFQQPDDAFVPFDLQTGTFDGEEARRIQEARYEAGYPQEAVTKMVYTSADEMINPDKRNIVSKEEFEIFKPEYGDSTSINRIETLDVRTGESKPYHEIKPIGDYQVKFDHTKRPSYQELMQANERENEVLDELTEKIEFLRDLRNERRHRINMMKIECANSFLVARTKRLADVRERKRIKRRDDLNLRAIEKADKLRRAQERQKIVQLMKERQMKRSEERRVATILRLERERRMERDAQYRSEVASLDAQIRHEQELIKCTELKMKASFAKNHGDKDFDKSLKSARLVSKYVVSGEKAEKMLNLEQKKREDRIEKISKKFNKNVK